MTDHNESETPQYWEGLAVDLGNDLAVATSELERLRAEVETIREDRDAWKDIARVRGEEAFKYQDEAESMKGASAGLFDHCEELRSDNAALKLRVSELEKEAHEAKVRHEAGFRFQQNGRIKRDARIASLEAQLTEAKDCLTKISESQTEDDYRFNPPYAATILASIERIEKGEG